MPRVNSTKFWKALFASFKNVFAIILHDDLIVLDLVINMGQFVIGVLPIHLQI